MNINEKIAIWLGLNANHIHNDFNFIHCRDQQKWIEDKLIELGYSIEYIHDGIRWDIGIGYLKGKKQANTYNSSKDLAFIEAVEQLIDKTNETTN